MIYITGDTHGSYDAYKLTTVEFPEQCDLTKDDCVIICGDFGGVWDGGERDDTILDWLDNCNFTTLFVDGNHENHPLLNQFSVVDFCGGKAHKIRGSIYHLMRGEIFTIEEKKFFAMGGASSHDMFRRKEGVSWWPEELPSSEEYQNAIKNLTANDWCVDYIISHCCADSIQDKICKYEHNDLTEFFEDVVKAKCRFAKWFFGHYHISGNIDDKYYCLFNKVKKIDLI